MERKERSAHLVLQNESGDTLKIALVATPTTKDTYTLRVHLEITDAEDEPLSHLPAERDTFNLFALLNTYFKGTMDKIESIQEKFN